MACKIYVILKLNPNVDADGISIHPSVPMVCYKAEDAKKIRAYYRRHGQECMVFPMTVDPREMIEE